jgi:putative transposase
MDGAKSQLAGDTLTRLNRIVGCWTDNGRGGDPNARPHIERFFHLIARHFAHRLPGTVGNSPESIERALGEPEGNTRLRVELTELEDMIHVLIANYNGTPHGGVSDKTPLEAMAFSVKAQDGLLRTVPVPLRSNLCLMQEARIVVIKGSTSKGIRPHINFAYVRYTSHALSGNAALIGKKLRIYYDVRDIRAACSYPVCIRQMA